MRFGRQPNVRNRNPLRFPSSKRTLNRISFTFVQFYCQVVYCVCGWFLLLRLTRRFGFHHSFLSMYILLNQLSINNYSLGMTMVFWICWMIWHSEWIWENQQGQRVVCVRVLLKMCFYHNDDYAESIKFHPAKQKTTSFLLTKLNLLFSVRLATLFIETFCVFVVRGKWIRYREFPRAKKPSFQFWFSIYVRSIWYYVHSAKWFTCLQIQSICRCDDFIFFCFSLIFNVPSIDKDIQ